MAKLARPDVVPVASVPRAPMLVRETVQLALTRPASAFGGRTQRPEPLQTEGETQSRMLVHDVWHPAGVHVYGVQSVVCPLPPVIV